MHNSVNVLPSNFPLSHPFSPQDLDSKDKAKEVHKFLLKLAKDESEKELKTFYRKTADFFREIVFGKTTAQIRAAVREVLLDYCDGSQAHPLELSNLSELTGIGKKELLPVLAKMVASGEILEGRRRRHNEPGEHYNKLYKLKV